ncbi:hypothetical protein [Thaumasiovibrio subtropicus]|uniref:hypothetical protein n=1 Tax=Thaumasiovibrio subtropicus TaxID=1891207 RepID=UPI000B359DC3|nr:hypothetical protein [Thaumasiovibrio subtropicus]
MYTKKTALAASVFAALLGLSACSDSDGVTQTGPVAPPAAKEFSTVISLVVPDSNGNPVSNLQNGKAKISVNAGAAASAASESVRVVDGDGKTLTEVAIPTNGVVALALAYDEGAFDNGVTVQIDFVVTADGNFSNKVTVSVDKAAAESGTITATVPLTSKTFDAAAENIAIASAEEVTTASTDITVDTEEKTAVITVPIASVTPKLEEGDLASVNKGATASVSIPANTTLIAKNAAGETVVVSGALSTNVSYFSADPDNAAEEEKSPLNQFPGGLEPASVANFDDGEEGGSFISAGFVAIEIEDEAGNLVKEFSTGGDEESKPVEITFTVPAGTKDENGNEVGEGSVIPFWSYDETAGEWSYEGDATLGAADADGNFPAVVSVNHLSYFNLDYFGRDRCKIQMTVSDSTGETNENLSLSMRRASGGWQKYKTTYDNSPNITLVRVPPYTGTLKMGLAGTSTSNISSLVITDANGNALDNGTLENGTVSGLNYCGGSEGQRDRLINYAITLDVTPLPSFDVDFTIVDRCNNASLETQQPGYVYIYTSEGSWVTWRYTSASAPVKANLKQGDYRADAYVWDVENFTYDTISTTFSVDSNSNVELVRSVTCEGGTGGTGAGDDNNNDS